MYCIKLLYNKRRNRPNDVHIPWWWWGGGEDNNSESAVTDLINDLEWQIASPNELLRLWV